MLSVPTYLNDIFDKFEKKVPVTPDEQARKGHLFGSQLVVRSLAAFYVLKYI